MKTGIPIKFRLSYVLIGILIITALGYYIFCIYLESNNITYTVIDIMAFSTGSTAIMTLLYHSFVLEYNIKLNKKNNRFAQAKHTYDMISEWHQPSMLQTISVVKKLLKSDEKAINLMSDTSTVKEFDDYLKENPNISKHFSLVLNYFENISIMIETKHINEIIVKKAFKSLFVNTYKQVRYFIDFSQQKHQYNWYYFEKISKSWIEKDKLA